jgi:hypothetical protein
VCDWLMIVIVMTTDGRTTCPHHGHNMPNFQLVFFSKHNDKKVISNLPYQAMIMLPPAVRTIQASR